MVERAASQKSADAYRTISEVAEELKLPQHVLRFWETRFPSVKPLKRAGGRRFYRPEDVDLLRAVKALLYGHGYTIRGVQRMLREQGPRALASLAVEGRGSLAHVARHQTDGPEGTDAGAVAPAPPTVTEDAGGESLRVPTGRPFALLPAASPGLLSPPQDAYAPPDPHPGHQGQTSEGVTDINFRLHSLLRELEDCGALLARARST